MPGCWEILQSNAVMCCILHTENTTIAWAFGLRNLIIPGPIVPLSGMPYDHARNCGVKTFLQSNCRFLFFLDSDVVAPRDTVLRLMRHNLPIVSGIYCRRSHPAGVPVAIKNGQWVTQFPPNALYEVDLVGAGCLLLRRDMLEKLPPQRLEAGKHWFDWKVDARGCPGVPDNECLSEDFTFNVHARKFGYKTYLDTGVICRHIGNCQATYGSLAPCDHTPLT